MERPESGDRAGWAGEQGHDASLLPQRPRVVIGQHLEVARRAYGELVASQKRIQNGREEK